MSAPCCQGWALVTCADVLGRRAACSSCRPAAAGVCLGCCRAWLLTSLPSCAVTSCCTARWDCTIGGVIASGDSSCRTPGVPVDGCSSIDCSGEGDLHRACAGCHCTVSGAQHCRPEPPLTCPPQPPSCAGWRQHPLPEQHPARPRVACTQNAAEHTLLTHPHSLAYMAQAPGRRSPATPAASCLPRRGKQGASNR